MRIIEIDGSYGEGGGQLLRYSVALASILGKRVRVFNIRAKRSNPGLRPQHLTALKTVAQLAGARISGLKIGSMEVIVEPGGRPRGGEYDVDIGTAGSIALLLQAVLPVLIAADSRVRLRVRGGTNVKWSPPIQYFQHVLLPLLRKFGVKASLKVLRLGFYPKGGGIVEVEAQPSYPLKPVSMVDPGELVEIRGVSYAANLPKHVAERQARSAIQTLKREGYGRYIGEIAVETDMPAIGPGSGVVLWARYENGIVGGDALGERGKRAELVGREAAEKLASALRSKVPVDVHALDNLVIYMALASGVSSVASSELTGHAETAIWLCRRLTGAEFKVDKGGGRVRVSSRGIGFSPP